MIALAIPSPICTTRRTAAARLAEFYAGLKHDGNPDVMDQRNYDAILDVGFDSKHKYYLLRRSGFLREPEYVERAIGRASATEFPRTVPVYHLNIVPAAQELRARADAGDRLPARAHLRRFQETYTDHEPDFFHPCPRRRAWRGDMQTGVKPARDLI